MDSLVLKDDHELCIETLLDRFAKCVRSNDKSGILHVGAHMGEEVDYYKKRGFKEIFLIEANPEITGSLEEKYADDNIVKVFQLAVSDKNGEVEFIIHTTEKGSAESASILPLADLGEIVPIFNSSKKYIVPSKTLDTFASNNNIEDTISLLVLDIQGAELTALSGGAGFLSNVNAVICEVNLIETYKNCALEPEIDDFFKKAGFIKELAIYHELYDKDRIFPAWGECLWISNSSYKDRV